MKAYPKLYKHDFSESTTESSYNKINLISSAECNRLLAAKVINFRLIMFQAPKWRFWTGGEWLMRANSFCETLGTTFIALYAKLVWLECTPLDFHKLSIHWNHLHRTSLIINDILFIVSISSLPLQLKQNCQQL